jgi:hypothetical protein
MEGSKTKKLMNPTSNKIQISAKRDTGFYVFLSKIFLLDYDEIELHALGDAINTGVKVGELLCRHEYTTISKLETTTIEPGSEGDTQGEDQSRPRRGKKAKLIVKLRKSAKFPELIKNFKIQKS